LIHFYKRSYKSYDKMLSRLAVRSLTNSQKQQCLVVFSRNCSSGQRDLVNFPRRERPIDKPPVRLGVFPEEWFQAFYPKTGVTGPYMALFGFSTFLASKEYFVMEHDFYVGVALAIVLGAFIKKVGPSITEGINKDLDAEEALFRSYRQDEIDICKATIAAEEKAQADAAAYADIITAKKEIVGLQLEATYRERLHEAYTQVKKRLDYQAEVNNVLRRMEQKHMVDWIISNVKKSITPAQEDAALKKCLADLKALSA